MAFDELGSDPSKTAAQDYTVSATGLVSRTFGVWTSNIVQYTVIVGIIGALTIVVSVSLLFALFNAIMVVGADPVSYYMGIFEYTTLPSPTIIGVSLLFALIAFIVYTIAGGAAIKFALDDYGTHNGDIRESFSHSFKRIFSLLGVQLVVSLLTSALLLPGFILLTNAVSGIDISDPLNPIFPAGALETMMLSAFLLLIGAIIMIYLSARFAPVLAIVLDTDLSAIGSLMKSWEITGGNVLHVIGGRILFGIAVAILGALVTAFTYPLGSYSLVVENIVITLLFSSLTYIFPVVLYRDLSSRTKGSSLEELLL
jgi:membrane-anchored glycerophosphoryl diester phosphodiesterase (GDPDase)